MIETRLIRTQIGNYNIPLEYSCCPICYAMHTGKVYDDEIVDFVNSKIKPHSTVIDAGACFGQMSLIFAKKAAGVYSFEANSDVYEIFLKNIKDNDAKNIYPFNCAVWDNDGQTVYVGWTDLKITRNYGGGQIRFAEQESEKLAIQTKTIDSLGLDNVSVIKTDIQGSDLKALRGAIETIKLCRPVLVFEYADIAAPLYGDPWKDYLKFLDSVGYKLGKEITKINFVAEPK